MKHIEVVAAIMMNEQNQIFCAQRKNFGELALKWEFPGGKIEPGETHQKALTREIKEELELTIKVNDYLMKVSHQYKTFHLTMYCYYCKILGGTLVLNDHIQFLWMTKEELSTLDWADADIPIIKQLQKGDIKNGSN